MPTVFKSHPPFFSKQSRIVLRVHTHEYFCKPFRVFIENKSPHFLIVFSWETVAMLIPSLIWCFRQLSFNISSLSETNRAKFYRFVCICSVWIKCSKMSNNETITMTKFGESGETFHPTLSIKHTHTYTLVAEWCGRLRCCACC